MALRGMDLLFERNGRMTSEESLRRGLGMAVR